MCMTNTYLHIPACMYSYVGVPKYVCMRARMHMRVCVYVCMHGVWECKVRQNGRAPVKRSLHLLI